MTPMTDAPSSRWRSVRQSLAEAARTQAALWERVGRIAPDPDPYLHWEPTASGWRLYGDLLPACDVPPAG